MSPANWFYAACDLITRRKVQRRRRSARGTLLLCVALLPGLGLVRASDKDQASPSDAQPSESPLQQIDVMPLPASIEPRDGTLRVTQSFSVALAGYTDPLLHRAAQRFLNNLSHQTGMPISESPASASSATLLVTTLHAGRPVQQLGEDESYTLDVDNSGAKLSAATPLGSLHGLETFLQLVKATPNGFAVPALHVDDSPRFPWRGLMFDVSRHFIPLDALRRNLDAMAAVKMNVLHLHLSDDQGFRVESKIFPRLQEMGSDGLYYTQAEIRSLIAYARDRGIRVVPEFDIPGHTTAWFVGYPSVSSGPGPYKIERRWGVFDPAMDPTREETYKFLDQIIGEMAALFPDSYFHIGGDEVNGKQWDSNPKIQAFMRAHNLKNNQDLQQYFTARVQKIVSRHQKFMVGWDEILTPGIPKAIVIQSWRGQKSLAEAAKQSYRGILSSGYYLDGMLHASQHYLIDPTVSPDATLTPEEQKLILGGEACMWAEFITAENIDSRIWPRTGAIAERLWSSQQTQDVDAMYRRMDALSWRLEWLGLTHRSSYHAMLGRLLESGNRDALDNLGRIVEPAGIGIREHEAQQAGAIQTSQTPLNRMVDALPPESEAARRFANAVNQLVSSNFADQQRLAFVRSQLTLWRDNDARLAPALAQSLLLQELTPVSRNLSSIGAIGLQALDYIAKGEQSQDSWRQEQIGSIQQMGKPTADLILAIVPAVVKLVEASSGNAAQKAMPQSSPN